MSRLIRFTLVALALATLSSCLGGKRIRYYTVTLPPTPAQQTSAYPVSLLIGHIGAPDILEDQPIVYLSGRNKIGVYQYHQWVEPPAQMVKIMLIRRLRASGKFQSIAQLGSSAQGEYVLHGRLYDFERLTKAAASRHWCPWSLSFSTTELTRKSGHASTHKRNRCRARQSLMSWRRSITILNRASPRLCPGSTPIFLPTFSTNREPNEVLVPSKFMNLAKHR